ncbi:MAG: EamA family transporter [Bacteroidetes bacterium]|nr:EamA family transporter [Bacteroidota bacterium]
MNWFALALMSALLSAAAAILQKHVLLRTQALEFSFLLSAMIMLLSVCIPLPEGAMAIEPMSMVILAGKSVMGGCAFLFVMMSLERDQISRVLPLLGLTPAVTAFMSWGVMGEPLLSWEWLGIAVMTGGVYLVESGSRSGSGMSLRAACRSGRQYYIVAALLLFAVSSIADKELLSARGIDPRVILVAQHVVYFVVFGVFLMVRRTPMRGLLAQARRIWPYLAGIAVLTIAYRFTQLEATKDASVALVLALKRTSILFASFFGGKLFADERLGRRIAGAALIVGAGFVILRNVG